MTHTKGGTWYCRPFKTIRPVLFGLSLLLPCLAISQTAIRYEHDENLKQYSTEKVPGQDDYIMAGTSFGPTSIGTDDIVPHFVYFTNDMMITSKLYDDAGFLDERAVDIVPYTNNGTSVMVCMARAKDATIDRDMIKVLELNADGTIASDFVINATTTTPGDFKSLYPMHSIMVGDDLYICGFITKNNTILPSEPSYGPYGDKAAFVLKYNFNTNMVICNRYDYTYGGSPTILPNRDFDIAMRMKVVPGGSNIFVTGSVNGVEGTLLSPTYLSATMNLVINPTTLAVISDNPFKASHPFNGNVGEFGVDIVPNTNGFSQGYYIVGNEFVASQASGGFDTNPGFFWATWVNNSFQPPLSPVGGLMEPRVTFNDFDYAWAEQVLNPTDVAGGYQMIIAGMQQNYNNSCDYEYPPSRSNYNPFLAEVYLTFNNTPPNATIGTGFKYFKTYMTSNGTGFFTDSYSYHLLGGGLSNPVWRPTFATRDESDPNSHIIFSAPHKPGPQDGRKLNLKYLHADEDGDIPGDCGVVNCLPSVIEEEVFLHDIPAIPSTLSVNSVNCIANSGHSVAYGFSPIDSLSCTDGQGFRPAAINNISSVINAQEIKIYPNPASDHISVSLPINIDGGSGVIIELMNIYGQKLAMLYQGKAGQLVAKEISLPDLPIGIYTVHILLNNEQRIIQRIKINQ